MAAIAQPEIMDASIQPSPDLPADTPPAARDYGQRYEELPQELKNALWELVKELERGDEYARRQEVRRILQTRLYWRGEQYWWWNEDVNTFWPPEMKPRGTTDEEFEQPTFRHVTNIFKAFGETIMSVLTQNRVPARFWPQSAQDPLDVRTAKNATKAVDVIQRNNRMETKADDAAYFLWCDGLIGAYVRYVTDGEQFGYDEQPVLEEQESEIEPASLLCESCGQQYPPEQAPMGFCPECGAELTEVAAVRGMVPTPVRVERIARGQEVVSLYGALHLRRSMWADEQKDLLYLTLVDEMHEASAKEQYPEQLARVANSGSGETGIDAMERLARRILYQGTPDASTNESQMNTFRRSWIRPRAFWMVADEARRAELSKLFPDGVKVCFYGDTFCEAANESMDEHWRLAHAMTGEGQKRQALGQALVPLQDQLNDAVNIIFEQGMYGVPEGFADEDLLDFEARARTIAKPGEITPVAALRPGEKIDDKMKFTQAVEPSRTLVDYRNQLFGPISQFICGAFPALFGGDQEGAGGETAAGYAMARNQALGRLGRIWRRLQEFWATVDLLGVKCFAKNRSADVEKAVFGAGEDWKSEWIRLDDMQGNIVAYPEVDQQYPVLQAQLQATIQGLLGKDPTFQALLQADPENAAAVYSKLGVSDVIKVPGADSEMKQSREIEQLLKEKPLLDPMAAEVMAAGGQPQVLPSIMPDDFVDDHEREYKTCLAWMRSETGQTAKVENPPGYLNVRAHAMAHDQMAKLKMAAQAAGALKVKASQEPIRPEEIAGGQDAGSESGSEA